MPDVAESVASLLRKNGASDSASLQRGLGVGQATLSRAIKVLDDRVVRIGAGRSTRYAIRREVQRIGASWPLFRVDAEGHPSLLGKLSALARDQYWLDTAIGEHAQLSDGLPFFLQDLVPQGFIGRTIPHRFPELGLPQRIVDWNDDQVLAYLSQRGEDCIGDLILGDESLARFLKPQDAGQAVVESKTRAREYSALADAAIAGEIAGSLAGGEHPKFTASVRQGRALRHVLVKFSPGGKDRVAQRWADLLVCEHLATRVLYRAGLTSAATELVKSGDRVFLEAERFDRTGARGRTGLISLAALANEHLGRRDSWTTATANLAKLGVVARADAETVRRRATFGRLIANTDMHFGNLSFRLSFDGPLALAPVYDMLPMFYAPLSGGALPSAQFEPPPPTGENLDIWNDILAIAAAYWREVAEHEWISAEFRIQAKRNADRVDAARTAR
jgi:hypothetical protein